MALLLQKPKCYCLFVLIHFTVQILRYIGRYFLVFQPIFKCFLTLFKHELPLVTTRALLINVSFFAIYRWNLLKFTLMFPQWLPNCSQLFPHGSPIVPYCFPWTNAFQPSQIWKFFIKSFGGGWRYIGWANGLWKIQWYIFCVQTECFTLCLAAYMTNVIMLC